MNPPPYYIDDISQKINNLENEFEIGHKFLEKLHRLSDMDIILLIDDSGSMNTPYWFWT